MSNSPAASDTPAAEQHSTGGSPFEALASTALHSIRVTSFWTAIVLPFLYVPLLLSGLSSTTETIAFVGLVLVNVVALYIGRTHRQW